MKKYLIIIAFGLLVIAGVFGFTSKKQASIDNDDLEVDDKTVVAQNGEAVSYLNIDPSFKIFKFADGIKGARVLAFDPGGTLLVSQTSEGKITALPNKDSDGKADSAVTVLSGLNSPHGIAFRCTNPDRPTVCRFFVAEENMLSEYEYDTSSYNATNKRKLLDLPDTGGGHYTRSIMFMPYPDEDILLISVGSSCNVCNEVEKERASILSYNIKTGETESYARGLRNSVFMSIHPVSGDIWATEMGRDLLGDNIPPDEINILKKDGNYGWPICYGKNIHDTVFDKNTYIRNPCMSPLETPSHIDIPAHSAPLGLAFVPEEGWPEDYWFNLMVAYHGSWNRSIPTGYKVVRMKLDEKGNYLGVEDFITGFIKADGTKIGRPVDIMILSGGTMYISDDFGGKVFRVENSQ